MMHVARVVDLPSKVAGLVSCLTAREDVEIVVGGVSAAVALCPDG
jgi:hypothetical protein